MKIEITDREVEKLLEVDGTDLSTLGPEEAISTLTSLIPLILDARYGAHLPRHMKLEEITLSVSVKGAPFGIGISGDAKIKIAVNPVVDP